MTIYYVSKDGNDTNTGTEINPWLTIQKAADTLVAGDTVYIKAGTYNECVLIKNSGILDNYITFIPYQTDTVTLNKSCGLGISNADWSAGFWIKNKSWIKIIGFKLINCYSGVHADTASNIIIKDNYIENPIQSAIKIGWGYSSNIIIDNNTVIRTNGTAWQEMISISNGHNIEVKNNHVIQNNRGEGIDFKDGTSDSSIHHNLVENTHAVGIYIDSYSSVPSSNIDVYSNIVHDAGYGANTGAYIMGNEYGELTTNVKFFNNIAYNSYIGFGLGYYGYLGHIPQYKDVYFINNTAYNNDKNFLFGMEGTNVVIRNNIGYKGASIYSSGTKIHTVDHNSWDIFPGQDPKFINESSYDFHLKSDSPAINKGSSINAPSTDFDGIIRPQGIGYDIGAYEYPCPQPQCDFTIKDIIMANYITTWNFNGNANDNFGNVSTTSNISFVNNTVVLNSQSLIRVTNKSTYVFNTGITLAGRINQTTSTHGYIISKAGCFLLQVYNNKFQAGIHTIVNGILTWQPLVDSITNITLNTWYDVIFTYNNHVAKLYVGNKLENSTLHEGSILQNTNEITIGNNASLNRGFIGSLDNVEMITNALSDEEVAKRYVLKSSEVCGDGICSGGEKGDNCPVDCGDRAYRNMGDIYHTKEESIRLWKELVTNHPSISSYEVIGKSYEGRDILLFKFGNPNGGKFMFDGQTHGMEDAGTETGYKFVKWVLESNEPEAIRIKNNNFLLVIPIINMDMLRRQNARRVNPDGTLVPYGVDINRNCTTGWINNITGADPNNNTTYKGSSAGSEPETQAVVYAMNKYRPQIYLNVHNGGYARLNYYTNDNLTSKIITRMTEISTQLGTTTMTRYLMANEKGNGYITSEAATYGANAWTTEICTWNELPRTLDEYHTKWYNEAFPIYAAMSNVIEVCQKPTCDFTINQI